MPLMFYWQELLLFLIKRLLLAFEAWTYADKKPFFLLVPTYQKCKLLKERKYTVLTDNPFEKRVALEQHKS